MSNYFQSKRFLITGGTDGIGKGIAEELWRRGSKVIVLSNQQDRLTAMEERHPGLETIYTDLLNWHDSKIALEKVQPCHGLVNCAGIIINEPFLEVKPENFEKTIAVNTRAILNVSQTIARKMIDNNIRGSIINISSQASKVALRDHLSYCASKGALDAMSRVMALELGGRGVRVNCLNPTAVMTELGRRAWADQVKAKGLLDQIPLGRFAEVEDVVQAVLFLLSDESSMITGCTLPVDGGFLAC